MTQTARPQTPWLVPVGAASDIEHKEFTIACRGHVQIGKVLGYLIVAASWQAKRDGGDVKNCEVVELLDISHKNILAQVKISQNSLTTYIKQLITWGYIQADTYRHTYRVYPQKINEAVATPPPLLEKKPRGKHASPKVISLESQTKIREEKITKLRKKITTLGIRFTNLGNQITTLRNEISNLGIVEPCEGALEQGVMNDSQAGDILRLLKDIKIDSLVISADAESDGGASFLSPLSKFEETLQDVQNGQAPHGVSPHTGGHSQEEPVMKSAGTSLEPATSAANDTTPTQNTLLEPPTQEQSTPTHETQNLDELKIRRKIKECSPEIQARRRKWQAYFNQRRGGELLPTKGECIGESNAIASLVDKFTDAELEVIDTFVLAEIFPFKVPANKHKLGGCALLKESQNAREVLKDRFKWPSQVITPVEEPKVVCWTPVTRIVGAIYG